jgi:flagellar FliL protein
MLIIILAVVLLAGGGGAFFFMKKSKPPADEEHAAPVEHAKPAAPPTFLPLDTLVVNLADPGGERFAQLGITLEISDAKVADSVKAFMPSIRNAVLLTVSQRTTQELLTVEGKAKLAKDIRREVSTPLGYVVEDDEDEEEDTHAAKKPGKKKKKAPPPPNPIKNVLFSSFIVQ